MNLHRVFSSCVGAVLSGLFCVPVTYGEVPPIVFVLRDGEQPKPRSSEELRPVAGPADSWSQLVLREADGSQRALVANQDDPPTLPVDFADPDVSYDGERIVFSAFTTEEKAWRIFEIGVDGTGLRQVTRSDRDIELASFGEEAAKLFRTYDDLDPCYLPDGRICFSSTRYPGVAPDLRGRATNLYVVDASGENLHRITTERYGADTPTVDPTTGEILYSRWWRSVPVPGRRGSNDPTRPSTGSGEHNEVVDDEEEPDRVPPGGYRASPPPPPPSSAQAAPAMSTLEIDDLGGINSWFISSIRPDGTGLAMHSGFRNDRELSQAWRPTVFEDGSVAALFVTETPFSAVTHEKGLRVFPGGMERPEDLGGPMNFDGDRVNDFIYASAAALPDGRLLVSAAPADAPTEFDLYVQDATAGSGLEPVLRSTEQELDATPVIERDRPPILKDSAAAITSDEVYMTARDAYEKGGSFKFIVENIFANAPVDTAIPSAPPLGKDLSIEFYMMPQRQSVGPRDAPILLATERIPPSGRVEVELPAGVPLFEVLRAPDDRVPRGRDEQIFHVGGQNFGHAGETARCVGCHAGHSTMAVPEDPSFTNIAPAAEIFVQGSKQNTGEGAEEQWRPENLVDRDTTPGAGEWGGEVRHTAAQDATWFQLVWDERVEAREVVLYARDPGIQGATISLLPKTDTHRVNVERTRVGHIVLDGPLSSEGTRVSLPADSEFHALHVELPVDVGRDFGTVAEVEVIGRSVEDPFVTFRRGDADCNSFLDITDAFAMFGGLFLGSKFCCEAAGDVDANGLLNLADPLGLLNYLFLNGPRPVEPSEECGDARSPLSCETEICPAG